MRKLFHRGNLRRSRRAYGGSPEVACLVVALTCAVLAGCALTSSSPVNQATIHEINGNLRAAGIGAGHVAVDQRGRIELQGEYTDEDEVDRAFSIAQASVGVKWVSPVTPERIRVTQWGECLSAYLSGRTCGFPRVLPVDAEETAPGPLGKRYALVVGVGQFENGIAPLRYAEKDAEDVYEYLVSSAGAAFEPGNVLLLRGSQATHAAIGRALDLVKESASRDDFVLLYFSSHGTPPDKYGGVHVVAYDTEVKPRERVWKTALTENRLRDFVEGVEARRLIVVLDACYSNGAYRRIAGFLPTGVKDLGEEDEGQGWSREDLARRLLGTKDLVVENDDPSASKPAGWGKVLISASGSGEKSWESERLRNSFFTYYFIDGLRRHHGSVKASFEYATPLVKAGVEREKGAQQNPQLTPSRSGWEMALVSP